MKKFPVSGFLGVCQYIRELNEAKSGSEKSSLVKYFSTPVLLSTGIVRVGCIEVAFILNRRSKIYQRKHEQHPTYVYTLSRLVMGLGASRGGTKLGPPVERDTLR